MEGLGWLVGWLRAPVVFCVSVAVAWRRRGRAGSPSPSVCVFFLHIPDSPGNVRLGIREQEALLQEFEALAEKMGEPDADIDQLLEEQVRGERERERERQGGVDTCRGGAGRGEWGQR